MSENVRHMSCAKDELQRVMDRDPDIVMIAYRDKDGWKTACGRAPDAEWDTIAQIGVLDLLRVDTIRFHYDQLIEGVDEEL